MWCLACESFSHELVWVCSFLLNSLVCNLSCFLDGHEKSVCRFVALTKLWEQPEPREYEKVAFWISVFCFISPLLPYHTEPNQKMFVENLLGEMRFLDEIFFALSVVSTRNKRITLGIYFRYKNNLDSTTLFLFSFFLLLLVSGELWCENLIKRRHLEQTSMIDLDLQRWHTVIERRIIDLLIRLD